LLVIVGLLAYHNSFRDGFVFDDERYIVKNPRIQQLWPPWEIITESSRPVVLLSLAANYALGGLNPWGYHLFNVAVHILAALTLYAVVRRTFATGVLPSDWDESAPWLAGMVSLIWLVHPLQTESVTYVIQRGESLMGLFYLLTLYCAIRGSGLSRSRWWQVGAVACCALGMATKPVMVTAPVVVLLYDRVFLARSWHAVVEQRWRLHAGLAATWLTLPLLLANGSSEWKHSAGFGFGGMSSLQYALTQPGVILHYLRLAFWPRPLCFDYGWQYGWPAAQSIGDALPALIVLGGLLVATAWAWRHKPALGFLGVCFFVLLAPTSSFVPVADLVVEHRMYLPLAAVVVVVIVGVFALERNLVRAGRNTRRMLEWVAGGTIVLLLTALTIQRNRDYRSDLAIWQDTVAKCPDNPRAHHNLGMELGRAGRNREEVEQYIQALWLKPDYADAHYHLGAAAWEAGDRLVAIEHWQQTLRIKPDYVEAQCSLALALEQTGKVREAIGHYEQALRIKPDYAEALNNLAWLLATLAPAEGGDQARAVTLAQRACDLTGKRVAPYLDTLAAAYASAGRFSDAIATSQEAIELARSDGQPQTVREIEAHLALYRAKHPYHRSAGATRPRSP